MNNITIAGRIGKDAEQRFTPGGDAVLSFSVADDQYKGDAIWWRCQIWGKRAESLAPYLLRGTSVTVSGNVTERAYTDKDGHERRAMDVRVSDVALQGGRSGDQDGASKTHGQQRRDAARSVQSSFPDDDIPF